MTPSVSVSLCLLMLSAASLTCRSQQDGPVFFEPPRGELSTQPHTVRGLVVNSVTGEPIYRALVQMGAQFATLTDHEGRFALEDVTLQGARPWATKPGYFGDANARPIPAAAPQTAAPQTDDAPLLVKLVPEAILSGTVTGQDGEPLPGIRVEVKMLTLYEGLYRWRMRSQTTTNSAGQYRFAELAAGKYALATGFHIEAGSNALATGFPRQGLPDAQSGMAYIPVRYPVAGAPQAITPQAITPQAITLTAGEQARASLSPPIEKLYPVTGKVAGTSQKSGFGLRVETADGEDVTTSGINPTTGEFRMDLPTGAFLIKATAYSPAGPMQGSTAVTVPQAAVHGLSLALESSAVIPVEIDAQAINQPEALAGAPVRPPLANLGLVDSDSQGLQMAEPSGMAGHPPPGGSGSLLFKSVLPGRYRMQATPDAPWYVASAFCGGIDLLREELVIVGSAAGCSIRVVLRNDTGSVHVSLNSTDNRDARQPAFVYLIPLGDAIRQMRPVALHRVNGMTTDVAPGRYLLLALDHQQELAWREPEALQRYAALGQQITVNPNSQADVTVNLVNGDI